MGNCVSHWPRHCQSWTVHILYPNSLWTTESSSPILGLSHLSSFIYNSLFLLLVIWFVISCKLFCFYLWNLSRLWFALIVIQWYQNYSGIPNVAGVQLVSTKKSSCESCSWKLYVKHLIIFKLILGFYAWII